MCEGSAVAHRVTVSRDPVRAPDELGVAPLVRPMGDRELYVIINKATWL